MATRTPVITFRGDHTVIFTYSGMLNGDDGAPIGPNHADYADRAVAVRGTFGVGGNLRMEGSGDDTASYVALNDAQGNVLDITTEKHEQILEIPGHTRPRVTAGDGTTSLTVIVTARRQVRPK